MAEAKPISSPMVINLKLSKAGNGFLQDPTLYRSVVGTLQYATITRPEISFSVSKVSSGTLRVLCTLVSNLFQPLFISP